MKKEVLLEIGHELRRQRLCQKLTLENISRQLKIRKSYLRAIENGNTKLLKFDAYTIGYVRYYAKFLKLDLEPFADLLDTKNRKKTITSVKSKNLITSQDFLPTKKLVFISSGLILALYIFVEIFV